MELYMREVASFRKLTVWGQAVGCRLQTVGCRLFLHRCGGNFFTNCISVLYDSHFCKYLDGDISRYSSQATV